MKISLSKILKDYLRDNYPYWVKKGAVEKWGQSFGYLGDNVARTCRKLQSEGYIEKKPSSTGKSIVYRFLTNSPIKDSEIIEETTSLEQKQTKILL